MTGLPAWWSGTALPALSNGHYTKDESVYVLAGEAIMTTGTGEERRMGAGDLAYFYRGFACTWRVTQALPQDSCAAGTALDAVWDGSKGLEQIVARDWAIGKIRPLIASVRMSPVGLWTMNRLFGGHTDRYLYDILADKVVGKQSLPSRDHVLQPRAYEKLYGSTISIPAVRPYPNP